MVECSQNYNSSVERMTQPLAGQTSRSWAWTLILLALLAIRLPTLARPAGGDQHLYTYVGQRLNAGEVPYRDAWDQKPPGIGFVYAVGWRVWPRESLAAVADLAAAALFLVLGDPGIQKLGGMYARAQCETFIALAVTGAVALAWRSIERPRALVLAGVCLGAAFWLKYNAIVFAVPVGAAALLSADGPLDRRRATMACS